MKLKSTRIYTESGCQAGVLTVEDGKITAFVPGGNDPDAIDYGEQRIIPGLFDTHNHGCCGYSADADGADDPVAEIRGYLKGLASQGTVNIFPTAMDARGDGIAAIAAVHAMGPQDGATILGIHSEGPWLNRVGEKGIRTGWPEVSVAAAERMVERGRGLLRLVALAPEIPGIDPVIDYFLNHGVTVAAAHSDNNYAQATAAYGRGVSVSTHTGNVMTDMHHRDVGGLGAALLNDGVECEVICDGMHICNEMLKIYFRVKSPDRFLMVSDTSALSGAPQGTYRAFDMDVIVTEAGFALTDTGRIMGSTQPLLYDVGNLVEHVGIPMETCLRMAALNPARFYGFGRTKGSIAVGKDADLVVISDDYKAQVTYAQGRKVYDRSVEGEIFNSNYLKEKIQ